MELPDHLNGTSLSNFPKYRASAYPIFLKYGLDDKDPSHITLYCSFKNYADSILLPIIFHISESQLQESFYRKLIEEHIDTTADHFEKNFDSFIPYDFLEGEAPPASELKEFFRDIALDEMKIFIADYPFVKSS